jgi:hypothetical protein
MSNANIRAALEQLVAAVENEDPYVSDYFDDAMVNARAALAAESQKPPSDNDLLEIVAKELGYDFGPGLQRGEQELFGTTSEMVDMIRAVLRKYRNFPDPLSSDPP